MSYDFSREARLFMVFDILGDTVRSGPIQWNIKRDRLEDVKNHVMDLLFMARLLRNYFPIDVNFLKIVDYIILHDLPEAITGDITKFEGVSDEERKRVNNLAIQYLSNVFEDVLPIGEILDRYENRVDIESKIVNMLDKVHSSTTFMKYQCEKDVDMDDSGVLKSLRSNPYVVEKIAEGKDIADIFYEFHIRAVNFSDEECKKYDISREYADRLVDVIKSFADAMYEQKCIGTLTSVSDDFPKKAMVYNKNKNKKHYQI